MASCKWDIVLFLVLAMILKLGSAEINATRVASLICGTGGLPSTTPNCIPSADMLKVPSAMPVINTAAVAFFSCFPKLLTCYTCGTESENANVTSCVNVSECALNPATYMKPDALDCFWKVLCNVPVSCQVEYEVCITDSVGKEVLQEFEECVEKNIES